jgi:hypothetical protein
MANNLYCDEGVGIGPFLDEDDFREFILWKERRVHELSFLRERDQAGLFFLVLVMEYKLEQKHKDLMDAIQLISRVSSDTKQGREALAREVRHFMAKHAADALHSKPGGSRDKKMQIRELWGSGKYSSRDRCAEEECAALGMSFSTARKALRGTPEPT